MWCRSLLLSFSTCYLGILGLERAINCILARTSHQGTTSEKRTEALLPRCPLFRGSTILQPYYLNTWTWLSHQNGPHTATAKRHVLSMQWMHQIMHHAMHTASNCLTKMPHTPIFLKNAKWMCVGRSTLQLHSASYSSHSSTLWSNATMLDQIWSQTKDVPSGLAS